MLIANILYLCAVSPRCYYDSVNYCFDSEHIPNITYLLKFTIVSYIFFLYEFHCRFRDYFKVNSNSEVPKDYYHLKVIIFLVINMSILVLTFREISDRSFEGVQTTIFVVLWFLYCFIRLFYTATSKAIRRFGWVKPILTILFVLLVSGRIFYVNRILNSCKDWNKGMN